MKQKLVAFYNSTQWFTDREAWTLFKLAAFGEAVGWTFLITGVLFRFYDWPQHAAVLLIAGQTHGLLFLIYIVGVFCLTKSLGWRKHEVILAALVSVPPYGTLVFEQWMARRRKAQAQSAQRQVTVRAIIVQGGKLLGVQPKDRAFWCLPGGAVTAGETPELALKRLLFELTGKRPKIASLAFVRNYQHHAKERLEFFFYVSDAPDYQSVTLEKTTRGKIELEAIKFIEPAKENFEPAFLKKEKLSKPPKAIKFL